MALLRPALHQFDQLMRPLNASEAAVAQRLERLDDGWTVYVQPRLAMDQPDFVAVHDLLGVCVIEVSDASPGDTLPVGVDPLFNAARTRSVLHDQFFALPSDGTQVTTAVRAAVIMPRCTDEQAAEVLGASDAGSNEREVEVWGGESVRDQLPRIVVGIGCAHPRPESIARVRNSLVACQIPDQHPTPAPRSTGAFEIEVNKQGGSVRRVRGASGTGKSFGLTARAAHLAAQGKTVLVLSFNVTMANHLRNMVVERCAEYGANATLVTCTNFHSLCTRIVQDAARVGVEPTAPRGARWTTAIVMKAAEILRSGNVATYDAVLIDEGQDFELAWWDLLRDHVLVPGGEMLLTANPTLDIYNRATWLGDDEAAAAGFDGPWITLDGSYRMPADLVDAVKNFDLSADRSVGGDLELSSAGDLAATAGPSHGSLRLWRTVDRVGDIGIGVGREVVRLLKQYPSLNPGDVTFICEYHHDGVAAVRQIEAAGYHVHHIFSRDPDDARRRRKYRFDPEANVIAGSTVHSFKGWQTTVLVLGIGLETKSKQLAHTALGQVARHPERPAVVSVISADQRLTEFGEQFAGLPIRPEGTAAPTAVPVQPSPVQQSPVQPAPAAVAHTPPIDVPTPAALNVPAQPPAPPSPLAPVTPVVPAATADGQRDPEQALELPSVVPIPPLVDPTPNAPIHSGVIHTESALTPETQAPAAVVAAAPAPVAPAPVAEPAAPVAPAAPAPVAQPPAPVAPAPVAQPAAPVAPAAPAPAPVAQPAAPVVQPVTPIATPATPAEVAPASATAAPVPPPPPVQSAPPPPPAPPAPPPPPPAPLPSPAVWGAPPSSDG